MCAGVKGERTKRRSPGNEAGKRRFRLSDVPRQSQRRTRETSRVTRASGSTEDAHSVTACAPTQRVEVAVREETSFVLCGDTRARPAPPPTVGGVWEFYPFGENDVRVRQVLRREPGAKIPIRWGAGLVIRT